VTTDSIDVRPIDSETIFQAGEIDLLVMGFVERQRRHAAAGPITGGRPYILHARQLR
jgi:hypothetical protein